MPYFHPSFYIQQLEFYCTEAPSLLFSVFNYLLMYASVDSWILILFYVLQSITILYFLVRLAFDLFGHWELLQAGPVSFEQDPVIFLKAISYLLAQDFPGSFVLSLPQRWNQPLTDAFTSNTTVITTCVEAL